MKVFISILLLTVFSCGKKEPTVIQMAPAERPVVKVDVQKVGVQKSDEMPAASVLPPPPPALHPMQDMGYGPVVAPDASTPVPADPKKEKDKK